MRFARGGIAMSPRSAEPFMNRAARQTAAKFIINETPSSLQMRSLRSDTLHRTALFHGLYGFGKLFEIGPH